MGRPPNLTAQRMVDRLAAGTLRFLIHAFLIGLSLVPAVRASRVDPVKSLRVE